MNQRDKDMEAYATYSDLYATHEEDFADGAAYARKELFERLREISESTTDPFTGLKLDELAKEYGL